MATGEYTQPYMVALQARIRDARLRHKDTPFVFVLDRDVYMKVLDEMNTDYYTVPVHRYTECAVFQGIVILPDPVAGMHMLSGDEKFCVLLKSKL